MADLRSQTMPQFEVELHGRTAGLHFAQHTFWGGGETQVYADTPTHRYIAYD